MTRDRCLRAVVHTVRWCGAVCQRDCVPSLSPRVFVTTLQASSIEKQDGPPPNGPWVLNRPVAPPLWRGDQSAPPGILAKRPAGPSLAAAAPMPYNRDIMNRERKLVAFIGLHPELHEALGLWMSDRKTCEAVYSRESALLRREMPEFARRRLEVHEPGAALSG